VNTWIERLARLGYASIGTVYVVVGLLAAAAGLGQGGKRGDQNDALQFILEQPFGRVLLAVIAVGLLGYVVWRIASGVTDSEHRGNDAKGMAIRASSVFRGLIYAALSTEVIRLVTRSGGGSGGGDQRARHWTGELFDVPFGRILVALAGLGVVAYGLYQLRGKLSRQLSAVPENARRISRFGIAARGVVFVLIGASIVLAAFHHNASEVRGTSGILERLDGWPLVIAGFGLAAYGVYAFINAKYRRIDAST